MNSRGSTGHSGRYLGAISAELAQPRVEGPEHNVGDSRRIALRRERGHLRIQLCSRRSDSAVERETLEDVHGKRRLTNRLLDCFLSKLEVLPVLVVLLVPRRERRARVGREQEVEQVDE